MERVYCLSCFFLSSAWYTVSCGINPYRQATVAPWMQEYDNSSGSVVPGALNSSGTALNYSPDHLNTGSMKARVI